MLAPTISLSLTSPEAMTEFAHQMAQVLRRGDTLLLSGPIGAGKSTFARAVIQARLGYAEDVPSPTFTLVQVYDHPDGDMWHCDLYRLTDSQEVFELGLDEAFADAICLIEWPDRLGDAAPANALHLTFAAGDDAHLVTISGSADWAVRLGHIDA